MVQAFLRVTRLGEAGLSPWTVLGSGRFCDRMMYAQWDSADLTWGDARQRRQQYPLQKEKPLRVLGLFLLAAQQHRLQQVRGLYADDAPTRSGRPAGSAGINGQVPL